MLYSDEIQMLNLGPLQISTCSGSGYLSHHLQDVLWQEFGPLRTDIRSVKSCTQRHFVSRWRGLHGLPPAKGRVRGESSSVSKQP